MSRTTDLVGRRILSVPFLVVGVTLLAAAGVGSVGLVVAAFGGIAWDASSGSAVGAIGSLMLAVAFGIASWNMGVRLWSGAYDEGRELSPKAALAGVIFLIVGAMLVAIAEPPDPVLVLSVVGVLLLKLGWAVLPQMMTDRE